MGGGEQHPAFEAVAHLVHLVLYGDDLAGEPRVVVEEGGVGEPHGDLGEVLHLDQDVHSPLQLGEPASVLGGLGSRLHRAGAGELPYLRHTSGGPCTKSTSPERSTSSASTSKSHSSSLRIAMGRIPVSTGRSTSPRERPSR